MENPGSPLRTLGIIECDAAINCCMAPFSNCPPAHWWLDVVVPLHNAFGVICKKGATTEIKAQVTCISQSENYLRPNVGQDRLGLVFPFFLSIAMFAIDN